MTSDLGSGATADELSHCFPVFAEFLESLDEALFLVLRPRDMLLFLFLVTSLTKLQRLDICDGFRS